MTTSDRKHHVLPIIISAAAISACVGFVVGISQPNATAQPSDDRDHAQAMPEMTPEQMEAIMRMQSHAEINEHHKELQKSEGSWLVSSKWWWGPGTPAEEHMMMAQVRPIMGGHFMLEEMSGLMDNGGQMMPWNGMAITGYDNAREQYCFVWFDNMTTSLTVGYGDKSGRNEWTYEYDSYDAMTGSDVTRKNVITKKSANEHVFDMYIKMPDGSWFKNMEMTYQRPGE